MKELSIEEKAERYDEAIKKVNDYYEGKTKLYSDVDKTLEYLFPALKESEDEIIRKELINYVEKHYATGRSKVDKLSVLAWLEKQGEKSTDEEMKEILRTEYEKGRADVIAEMQKPAWSEEDDEMYKEVLTDIIYAKNNLEMKECLGLSKRAMRAFNWFSKRYKSLKDRYIWKPSDEQMKQLGKYCPDNRPLTSSYEQLKKLKNKV